MIIFSRLRRAAVVAGCAVALSLGALASAVPAHAAAGPTAVSTSLTAHDVTAGSASSAAFAFVPAGTMAHPSVTPDICGPTNYIVALFGTRNTLYICAPTTVTTAGRGPFTRLVSFVANRVWLHQNANGSGWADCFRDPFYPSSGATWTLTGFRDANPGNILVSLNTARC